MTAFAKYLDVGSRLCGSPKKDRTRNLSGEILNHLKINYLRSRHNSSEGVLGPGDFGVMSFVMV